MMVNVILRVQMTQFAPVIDISKSLLVRLDVVVERNTSMMEFVITISIFYLFMKSFFFLFFCKLSLVLVILPYSILEWMMDLLETELTILEK